MALYRQQSPYQAALQGMQNASATTAGMTKKQEVKEPKKSFGGALGSMIAGGSYGLGMADMFTGSEATKAMWGGVKGALPIWMIPRMSSTVQSPADSVLI